MLSQSMPLPPLKANNQRTPESYAASNIRSEMTKMQQSLQRSNQLYQDYFSDIPPNISESLHAIRDYQKSISKEIQKNKLEQFKAKLNKYNLIADSLSQKLQQHIAKSINTEQNDFFAEIFPTFEKSLMEQNRAILENLEKTLSDKVDYYEQKVKTRSDESKYLFKSPFSDSAANIQPRQIQAQTTPMQTFSTLDTINDLQKHSQRIQSLENKVNILSNRQKEAQIASKNDKSREVAKSVIDDHQKVQQLLIKSHVIDQKIDHQPPPNDEDPPQVILKNKSNVEQQEFNELMKNVNEMNEQILAQIESFSNYSEQKINGFNLTVDSIEMKVLEFENSVNNLNKLNAIINAKIERAEENNIDAEKEEYDSQINRSNISNLIDSFKVKLSEIQEQAKKEIDQLKMRLNDFEAHI